VAVRREVQRLHEELERAIEREEFENAASLRDRIRAIETPGAAGESAT
jgi:protein arginine kinase activator